MVTSCEVWTNGSTQGIIYPVSHWEMLYKMGKITIQVRRYICFIAQSAQSYFVMDIVFNSATHTIWTLNYIPATYTLHSTSKDW